MRRLTEPFRPDRPAVAEVAAGAVVVREGTRDVVLLHHLLEDRWCFPKGHIEPGESVQQAATREIAEETGFRTFRLGEELVEVAYRFYDPRRDVNVLKTTIYFLAFTAESVPRPEPLFDRWAWWSIPEAREHLEYDTDRRVLELSEEWLARPRTSVEAASPSGSSRESEEEEVGRG